MARPLRALCAAALLAVAACAHAEIDRPAAEELVRKSGVWDELGSLGPQVAAGMQQALARAGSAPAEAEKARLDRVVETAYAPERLRSASTGVIAARLEPPHLQALREWFASPVGQAIEQAEDDAAATTRQDPRLALKRGAALLESMPAERRRLLADLLAATRAVDALVQITIGTTVAVQVGAASAMPTAPALTAQQVRTLLEARRPQLQQAFTVSMLAQFALAYEKVPARQLMQYLAFIRTPAGTAFNDAVIEALDKALTDAATEMGRQLPGIRDERNT